MVTAGDMFDRLRRAESLARNFEIFQGALVAFQRGQDTDLDASLTAEGILVKVTLRNGSLERSRSQLVSWSDLENHSDRDENKLSWVTGLLYRDAIADLGKAVSE